MNTAQDTTRMMWQHPYVNVFKQFKVESWKRSTKEGDVASVMDKQLKCTVFRILGSIPAGNYIQIPKTTTQSLGLTGRYLYILFKPLPTRYFVVHVDTATEEGMTIRISFSNLFKEFKCTATWLQFPFLCQAAKGSVEHRASQGAKTDMVGAAPLAQKWTMLVLDLQYILSVYINRKYSHVKNLRICANMAVKNCFTSDIEYDPRISFRKARELGIKSLEQNLAPMPRDMNFHVPKNKAWDDLYDLVRFPTSPEAPSPTRPSLLPFDSIQRDDRNPLVERERRDKTKRVTTACPGSMSPQREASETVSTARQTGFHTNSQRTISVATAPKKHPKSARLPIVSELPPVGLNMLDSTEFSEPKDVTLVESGTGDVHIFTDGGENRSVKVHRHFTGSGKSSTLVPSIATIDPKVKKATIKTSARSSSSRSKDTTPRSARSVNSTSPFRGLRGSDKNFDDLTSLEPDPILKMRQIIGFGSGLGAPGPSSLAYRHQALWHPGGQLSGGNEIIVYAVHAVIVAMEIANGHQHFFVGHTDSVVALAFNDCTKRNSSSTSILASAQKGDGGVVRVWRFDNKKCSAIIKSQQANSMNILSFSGSGGVLVGCGRDTHSKTLIIVWDTSGVVKHGSVSVIARARADVEITRLCICPTDDTRLVTCGRENIRFWRVRSGQLRSCPVSISNHKIGEITDITFAKSRKVSDKNVTLQTGKTSTLYNHVLPYSVYACSKAGYIIEIDFHDVGVKDIHRLLPTNQDMDSSQKGIRLNVMRFSESYLATGSDDGFLRLWPLDLETVFLEAKHEGPVADLDITPDGMKVLASTSAGTLGYLDVTTRQYTTIMRSHTDKITDCCVDGLRRTITTCSEDGSIRVWDVATSRQLYDFTTPDDTPVAISCHPTLEIFACGFQSGAIRVFHVKNTSLLSEHQIHSSKVTGVIFAPSGEYLYSAEVKGSVALFDTSDVERTGSAVIRALPRAIARGDKYGPRSIAVAPDSRRVAFVGPTEYTVTVASAATLDELLRIDISTGLHLDPDILKQKVTVDCPLRVCFSTARQHHLLVVTTGNRLLKLGLKDGCLLSVTENIHRAKVTSICIDDDGKYFGTAGDNVLKIWDYNLSKDINFQVFIGHCGPVSRVLFSPDQLSVISCGLEGVFLWDFLGDVKRQFDPNEGDPTELDIRSYRQNDGTNNENILSVGRSQRKDILGSARRDSEDSVDMIPTKDTGLQPLLSDEITPQPRRAVPRPTGPSDAKKKSPSRTQNSGWVAPDTLRTADLDATDVSEFMLDTKMMAGPECGSKAQPSKASDDPILFLAPASTQDDPIKVFWGSNTVKGREALSPIKKVQETAPLTRALPTTEPTGFHERPSVLKHFCASENPTMQAARRYAPRKGEEGLKLEAVIGYNGNGRGNLVWNPDTGIFAYSSGRIVVLEDLANGTQKHLTDHKEEISTLALQYDSQILACASCEKGMVQSEIGLWDIESGECRAVLKRHEHDVVAMAYSRDDRFLVSIGDYRENTVVLWSGFDGETKPTVLASSACKSPIHHVVWDPASPNEFVTVGHNSSITFWLVEEYGSETQLQYHQGLIPDSVTQACGRDNAEFHFTCACYGMDKVLFVGTSTGAVTAWDTQTNECFLHWKADNSEICCLASKGARLISGGGSRSLRLWTLAAVQKAKLGHADNDEKLRGLLMEDEMSLHSEITSAVFDETLDLGIVSTTAGTLWYVDWNSRNTVRMVTGHKSKINGITFDNGEYFATCSEEGSVRLWAMKTLELTVQFQVLDQPCACVTFSHSREEDKEERDRPSHRNDVVPPAREMLAAGYGDGTLRVFDVDKLILMLKLQPHSVKVTAVAFSSDNCTLLSGSMNGRIAVTSLATGVTLRLLDDHLGTPITQITVSTREDHPASISAHLVDKESRRDRPSPDPSVWLATGGNRRVSVWVSCWSNDQCDMVDWLTFPAPCFAPDGTQFNRNDKSTVSVLPPSRCIFHPSNPDLLVYTGYGMEKMVQLYSLAKRKVVKTFSIPNWALSLDACNSTSGEGSKKDGVQLLALGTESRLVELVDACHGTFQDFCGHYGAVDHVKFSPDGKRLLTASGTELLMWKVVTSEG